MNQTSQDENYNNNQLEDIVLIVPTNHQNSDMSKRNERHCEGELKMVKI